MGMNRFLSFKREAHKMQMFSAKTKVWKHRGNRIPMETPPKLEISLKLQQRRMGLQIFTPPPHHQDGTPGSSTCGTSQCPVHGKPGIYFGASAKCLTYIKITEHEAGILVQKFQLWKPLSIRCGDLSPYTTLRARWKTGRKFSQPGHSEQQSRWRSSVIFKYFFGALS